MHSQSVGRLIILIIDLVAVIKRYLVIILALTINLTASSITAVTVLWNSPVSYITVFMFFVEYVYSFNFMSVLVCIIVLNIQAEIY